MVYTDHKPLISLAHRKELSKRQFRWFEIVQDCNPKLCYRQGKDQVIPDAISRCPDLTGELGTLVIEPSFLAQVSRFSVGETVSSEIRAFAAAA